MIFLYMDHHVPSAITEGLRKQEWTYSLLTRMARRGLTTTLSWTEPLGRVLFSQDQDLLAIAHRRLETGPAFAGVVYAHQLGISIGQAVRDLELIAKILDPDDMRDRVEYLPYS